jgi:IS30 family transposase
MKQSTRVSLAEREEISRARAAGSRLRVMARPRERAPRTVGRELRRAERIRSTDRAKRGPHVARRAAQRPRTLLTPPHRQADGHAQLTQCWSPEQSARRLKGGVS